MEEIPSDIKHISINRKKTDDYEEKENVVENAGENEDICYSAESSNYEPTPERFDSKNMYCILCRDYSSPICTNCKQKTKVYTNKKNNKKEKRIVPNGKVKALAKQFEYIFPEIKNDLVFSICIQDSVTKESLSTCSPNKKIISSSSKTSNTAINESSQDLVGSEAVHNSPGNISVSSTSSSVSKNKVVPIKDPDICGLVDPIEAIFKSNDSSIEKEDGYKVNDRINKDMYDFVSNAMDLENPKQGVEYTWKNEDDFISIFESLNHIEQRALLISWITTLLSSKGTINKTSRTDEEIVKILRELVEDLELNNNEYEKYLQDLEKKIHSEIVEIATPNEKKSSSSSCVQKSSSNCIPNNKLKYSKIINGYSGRTRGNPNFSINIGIPEDEEVEEYTDQFMFRTKLTNGAETESVIVNESELSPKSVITLTDEFEDNSITKIGNNFFGFIK